MRRNWPVKLNPKYKIENKFIPIEGLVAEYSIRRINSNKVNPK